LAQLFPFCVTIDIITQKCEENFEAGPTERPEDEDVEMDLDEDLPRTPKSLTYLNSGI
jgi:hypothetical protein